MRRLTIERCEFAFKAPFTLATRTIAAYQALVVRLDQDGSRGWGESPGIHYLGETLDGMVAAIDAVRPAIEAGADRDALSALLPPGGARSALDAALWDLDCRLKGCSIWELTGIKPRPLASVFSLSIAAEPSAMAAAARAAVGYPILKIKIDADDPLTKVAVVRQARPDAKLVVDANQALKPQAVAPLLDGLHALGVDMLEQPLPRGDDAGVRPAMAALPVYADESCQSLAELDHAAGHYDGINIKLDKAGGLSEGLALMAAARERGLGVMVGNMFGTSLAMAPAFVLAQAADYVDLDGPLYLRQDRAGGLVYQGAEVSWPGPSALWGGFA